MGSNVFERSAVAMFGHYGEGKEFLPRVIHISIARYHHHLPQAGESLAFLVSIHEEGTGITWQQNVTVDPATEERLLETVHNLYLWSLDLAHTPEIAQAFVSRLGEDLYEIFIGDEGNAVLQRLSPTALLMNVDETILNLPWELIRWPYGPIVLSEPFGRLVTTRLRLTPGRDPLQEDRIVRILGIANPTQDLGVTNAVTDMLKELEGNHGSFGVSVSILAEQEATLTNFREKLADDDFDILHFAGHGFLHPDVPNSSALRFADGDLTAGQVAALPWQKPPSFVFNSACESGRAVGGLRLASETSQSSGLASAFLAAGVYGYAGYFWPVSSAGASLFAKTFYRALFWRENVGIAFLEARKRVAEELPSEIGDLTAYSAILYGDAASKHRRDLAMAA
jgi:hypothetical protein